MHVQCPRITVHHTTQDFTHVGLPHVTLLPCLSLSPSSSLQLVYNSLPQFPVCWALGQDSLTPHWYLRRLLCSHPHRSMLSCPFFAFPAVSRTHCKFPREAVQLCGSWNSESWGRGRDRRLLCVPTHPRPREILVSAFCLTETCLRVLKS